MAAVFEKILEMSLTSAAVIVVIMAIRLLLRKAPRKYSYALWSVAAFRLVCPVSFRAVFSIFNFTKRLEQTEIVQTVPSPTPSADPLPDGFLSTPPGVTGDPIVIDPDYIVTYPAVTPPVTEPDVAVSLLERAAEIAAVVWLIGLATLVIYGMVSYIRLRRRMATAVLSEDGVWLSDQVQSPFILGFFKPKIYLPFGLSEDEQRYVLAHERYHLKRWDHVVRPLSFLVLAVHWFNPFVWAAYYLMGSDMEMGCDEKVLSTEDNIRKAYSTTLLSFAANRRFPSPSPLAFGEGGVKRRIKNALNWKKPRTWVTIIAIIVCIVAIVVCAADPAGHPYDWAGSVTAGEVERAELCVTDGDPQRRELTESEINELVEQLNQVKRGEYGTYPNGSGWAFPVERKVTITCGGVDYVLELGVEAMTIFCGDEGVDWRGETYWHVSNDSLKDFIRGLEGPTEEPAVLTRWNADLTHDGVEDTITLTWREDWQTYCLTVENAAGEKLWQGEAGLTHAAWDGFYLYERDGKHYLMRWLPAGSTGVFSYGYDIFSLTETGEQVRLTSGAFFYDLNSVEGTLSLEVERLEAFEREVNALLGDAIVLITTDEGTPCYSTEDVPLCRLWTAPVSEVREWKQSVMDRLPLVMAYMELEPELLACVEEQTAIKMDGYDLAYVEQVENIRTGAVGATGGYFIYRVTYKPGDYDGTAGVTWQSSRYFYIVTHERSGETSGAEGVQWYFVAALSEEELQSRFNTPEMLGKYSNDLYLAAVLESVDQWRAGLKMYYVVDMPLGERDYVTVAAVYGKDPAYYYSVAGNVIPAAGDGVRYYVMGVGNSYAWAGNFKSFRTYRAVSKDGYLQSVEEVETFTKNAILRSGKPYTGELSGTFSCLASRYVPNRFEQDLKSYTFCLREDGSIDISATTVGTGPAITYSGTYQYDRKTGAFTAKVTGRYANEGDVTIYPEAEVKGKLYEYGGFVHFICESSGIHILSEKDPLPLTFVPNADGWSLSDFTVAGFDKDGPGDFGYRVSLSDDEIQSLPELLDPAEWSEFTDLPEYGLTVCLILSDPEGRRLLYVLDGVDGKAVIKLSDPDTGESVVYLASEECLGRVKELAVKLKSRAQ